MVEEINGINFEDAINRILKNMDFPLPKTNTYEQVIKEIAEEIAKEKPEEAIRTTIEETTEEALDEAIEKLLFICKFISDENFPFLAKVIYDYQHFVNYIENNFPELIKLIAEINNNEKAFYTIQTRNNTFSFNKLYLADILIILLLHIKRE